MQKEIAAHRSQHAYELSEKDKKILELENEVILIRRQGAHAVERFVQQLDEAKEQVIQLKKNQGAIGVYKKKLDDMGSLKQELLLSQEQNQKLNMEIQNLQKDSGKEFELQESIQQLRKELEKVKKKSEKKDLKLQEVRFQLKDGKTRIQGHEQKETFFQAQIEKLSTEASQLQEELNLAKIDKAHDAMSDTQRADLRDQYNSLLAENRTLKNQNEVRINSEILMKEQALNDAKGLNSLLESKNRQLESRLEQLETRLQSSYSSQLVDQMQKSHEEEIKSMRDSERRRIEIEEGGKIASPVASMSPTVTLHKKSSSVSEVQQVGDINELGQIRISADLTKFNGSSQVPKLTLLAAHEHTQIINTLTPNNTSSIGVTKQQSADDSMQMRIDSAENQDNKSINDGEQASVKREEIATFRQK